MLSDHGPVPIGPDPAPTQKAPEPLNYGKEISMAWKIALPMGLQLICANAIMPFWAMYLAAGTTPEINRDGKDGEYLQSAMGFGRSWYNFTLLTPMATGFGYFMSTAPGTRAAGRPDRMPVLIK